MVWRWTRCRDASKTFDANWENFANWEDRSFANLRSNMLMCAQSEEAIPVRRAFATIQRRDNSPFRSDILSRVSSDTTGLPAIASGIRGVRFLGGLRVCSSTETHGKTRTCTDTASSTPYPPRSTPTRRTSSFLWGKDARDAESWHPERLFPKKEVLFRDVGASRAGIRRLRPYPGRSVRFRAIPW